MRCLWDGVRGGWEQTFIPAVMSQLPEHHVRTDDLGAGRVPCKCSLSLVWAQRMSETEAVSLSSSETPLPTVLVESTEEQ
jgi:hypothetical protein